MPVTYDQFDSISETQTNGNTIQEEEVEEQITFAERHCCSQNGHL